ncbi:NDP-sugar synthase [Candidatus Aenigmatarchaeota archaeon]
MKAVILCGGMGKRMRDVSEDIPKPMIEIEGKPILEHQIDYFKKHGITEFVFCTGHQGDIIKKHFKDGKKFGVDIKYSHEKEALGTGGAIKNAEDLINDNFILLYGDTMINIDIEKIMTFHTQHYVCKGCILTITIHETDHPQDSDLIKINEDERVVELFPKPNKEPFPSRLSKSSLFISSKEIFEYLPMIKHDFEKTILPKLVKEGKVAGYLTNELIRDVGTPERYEKFKKDMWVKKNLKVFE